MLFVFFAQIPSTRHLFIDRQSTVVEEGGVNGARRYLCAEAEAGDLRNEAREERMMDRQGVHPRRAVIRPREISGVLEHLAELAAAHARADPAAAPTGSFFSSPD